MINPADYPFYRPRLDSGRVTPWTLADLEEFAAAHRGDPFAGRVIDPSAIKIALQHEATGEPPVWGGLGAGEADDWAGVLANIWRRWGISAGETIALFDYGSSPLVLLASSGYVPYLRRGAAERLGIAAVCNDGVATMAARMVSIIETLRPSALVLRRDVLVPFTSALESSGVSLVGRIRWIAVSEPEGVPAHSETERFARTFGVPIRRVLRCEAAFLIAGDCSECGLFHLDSHYRVELVSGVVTVTTRFANSCPAIHYSLGAAESVAAGCPVEPRAKRLKWD